MYAIFETGGKQYRVSEGDVITIEKLPAEPGEVYAIEKVLAVEKDGSLQIGTPIVAGAKISLKITKHGKGKKIIVFKYKPKKNYRRKRGHRQPFTMAVVEKIEA